MTISNFILVTATAVFLLNSNFCLASNDSNHQRLERLPDIGNFSRANLWFSSTGTKIILVKDSDRGCCVSKTEKASCTYTSEGYCSVRATEANIKFEFYKDKSCRELTLCE